MDTRFSLSKPTPYTYAVLSKHVYQDNVNNGEQVALHDGTHKLAGWKVWGTYSYTVEGKFTQAAGRAISALTGAKQTHVMRLYANEADKQMVMAYQGLNPTNIGSLDAFFKATNQQMGEQAYNLLACLEEAFEQSKKKGFSLSITGHGLGGWLATLSVFMAKGRYKPHFAAVTFDSIGAQTLLEHIKPQDHSVTLEKLDITNYLSSPNLINCAQKHIGTCYRIVFPAQQYGVSIPKSRMTWIPY